MPPVVRTRSMEIVDLLEQSNEFEATFRELAASDVPYDAAIGNMMVDLLDSLRRDPFDGTVHASHHPDLGSPELWLQYSVPNGSSVMITASVDRPDHGPLTNGLPKFHYRLAYRLGDSSDDLPTEHRTPILQEAHGYIRNAILATHDRS